MTQASIWTPVPLERTTCLTIIAAFSQIEDMLWSKPIKPNLPREVPLPLKGAFSRNDNSTFRGGF